MRSYRLVLLLKSGLKKEQKDKLLESVKKWAGNIKDEKIQELGEKKLIYTVAKQRSGEYVVMDFNMEKVNLDLDKKIVIEDDILRHLLVRIK
ncbi:MAG: 30S ribosomal protein S6 [Candidatus Levybacteria bacterium RIFCSPHIGHO2_01_FULL_36_15]|nr:MAG: 30S ribosomal protein S6 [Candidatus Levybacteria bacterium RIFCSPHIGHO2_01_FULL_36_15]OGH38046.1 MAG: 30S ribosomal protein S6 [Candidatus Levybacteria bacterium RIFCSPLOWO2_01_FULL_36_10]